MSIKIIDLFFSPNTGKTCLLPMYKKVKTYASTTATFIREINSERREKKLINKCKGHQMSELFIKTFVFIQTHFESVYVHPYTHSAISLDLGYNLVMWKVISSKEIQ